MSLYTQFCDLLHLIKKKLIKNDIGVAETKATDHSDSLPALSKPSDSVVGVDLNKALLSAILAHDLKTAQKLLKQGANPNHLASFSTGSTVEMVSLSSHSDDDEVQESVVTEQKSLLVVAIETGVKQLVQLLTDHGATLTDRDRPWASPLHIACLSGRADIVEVLVNAGANVNERAGSTFPLHKAIESMNLDTVRYLLAHGAYYRQISGLNYATPFMITAAACGDAGIIQCLAEHGTEVDRETKYAEPPLCAAAENSKLEAITLLVRLGADINACDDGDGYSPLHIAIGRRHVETVNRLLELGADVENTPAYTNVGRFYRSRPRPIVYAIRKGNLQIVTCLINHGAILSFRQDRKSPFTCAVESGDRGIIKAFLDKGFSVNHKTFDEQNTPLQIATACGYTEIVRWLIELGADASSVDQPYYIRASGDDDDDEGKDEQIYRGKTPFDIAVMKGYDEVVEILNKTRTQ